ncbi:5-formyltetrahydrofolate cyclo-ligase [Pedobacter yulinensis]|uniref:5-formyltetrahydrofolate cyclo-ligase n=2 Tax=Pedobacter yulinensis TaxID=2126353 RepID=A0A2T3HS75_9SPHI|nr:5-formyltetrahydrofolate cyclo-ligase [Pedobacter yulinensis]
MKKDLRRSALAARMALSEREFESLNSELLGHFTRLDLPETGTVHIFLPIESKREPDTFRLIDWLRSARPGLRILVPKADFDTALMSHHEYLGRDDLKKNLYEILEPEKGAMHDGEIDIVFVPLLAADRRGYRVGYGKGFYDRFLDGLQARAIGISLAEPIAEITDIHDQDIRLDACLTPSGLYTFGR